MMWSVQSSYILLKCACPEDHIRYVGMNEVLLQALQEAYDDRREDSDLVVNSATGNFLDNQNFVKRHFIPDRNESGVSSIRFHDMRHSFSSIFMMNRGNLFDLQKILGHKDIKMTMRYAHLAKDYILSQSNVIVIGKNHNVISVDFKNQRAN